ncbi:IS3 family transposase [Gleimia hominis]|uniref:IS3 family transposase n=1 Tax=Gleimia hominis TaxID=595468 RepID=UPI000C801569
MVKEKANNSVTMMVRLLEVSRSGVCAWIKRRHTFSRRCARQRDLNRQVQWFHGRSRGTYGAPRITADLHAAGMRVDRKTVAWSMKRKGLEGLSTRSLSAWE